MSFEQLGFNEDIQLDIDKQIRANIHKILHEQYEAKFEDIMFEKLETYKVIKFFNKSVIRIIEKNKTIYISVQEKYATDNKNLKLFKVKSELPWVRLEINSGDDIFLFSNIFCDIYEDMMPDTFDCCSRYMKCSDELKCVQPIPKLMRECRYRKKLLKGIVFYGDNCNV